jgi:hypothetical protein
MIEITKSGVRLWTVELQFKLWEQGWQAGVFQRQTRVTPAQPLRIVCGGLMPTPTFGHLTWIDFL